MDFVSNKAPQIQEMLKSIGVSSFEELIRDIPTPLLHSPPIQDDGLSEMEVNAFFDHLSKKNTFQSMASYLGGGAYDHYVPAFTQAILSRSEFLTSYTPYQAEASQGVLQATFEFQSMIAALTDLPVANASVYDGGSACAEAVKMALNIKQKKKIAISKALNPLYRRVVDQYVRNGFEIVELPWNDEGKTSIDAIANSFKEGFSAFLFQSPNVFGVLEDAKQFAELAQASDALAIQCSNPLSHALYRTPGENNIDIAVGDCQPLGLPLQFGGPYVGYMACKDEHKRFLPGRIVGQTTDVKGNRGYVLTMQPREQHIRREKAISNICTNQSLAALATLITALWYGPKGLIQLALTNYRRTNYLRENLSKHFTCWQAGLNEFVLFLPCPVEKVLDKFRKKGIEPGLPLNFFFPGFKDALLVCATEKKDLTALNLFVEVAKTL